MVVLPAPGIPETITHPDKPWLVISEMLARSVPGRQSILVATGRHLDDRAAGGGGDVNVSHAESAMGSTCWKVRATWTGLPSELRPMNTRSCQEPAVRCLMMPFTDPTSPRPKDPGSPASGFVGQRTTATRELVS
jgi:hypothetical protein